VVAATSVPTVLPSSAPRGRKYTAVARAERGGRPLCAAMLVVVDGPPGRLGVAPVEDMTAWFHGALDMRFEIELEEIAECARGFGLPPEGKPIDFVLQAPGGELRLEGCTIGDPVRTAGPASTLEFRLSHPGPGEPPQRGLRLVA
jgi:hypothetical protein